MSIEIGKKLLDVVKLVEPDEIAELITEILGNKIKVEIIKIIVNEVGLSKLAELARSKPGSIASSLKREKVGDDLAFRIFKGVAKEKPHILRFALEAVLGRYEKIIDSIIEKAKRREEEFIKATSS